MRHVRGAFLRGAVAAVASGALVFASISPTFADTVTPPDGTAATDTATPPPVDPATPPADDAVPPAGDAVPPAGDAVPPADGATPPPGDAVPPTDDQSITLDDDVPPADGATEPPAEETEPPVEGLDPGFGVFSVGTGCSAPGEYLCGPGTGAAPADGAVTITVQAGGARTSANVIAPLSGAVFRFYSQNSATATPDQGQLQAECTTDATGRCWVNLPTRPQGYLVAPWSAPDGWAIIPTLETNPGTNAANVVIRPYRFHTGAANGNTSASRTFLLPLTGSGETTSSGTWMFERLNPTAPARCGLKVGMLVDLSSSVTSGSQTALRTAARTFVEELTGTPSQMAIHTFGTSTPAGGAANTNLPITILPVTGTTGNPVWEKANGLTSGLSNEWTNWDRGLWYLDPTNTIDFDVVLMLTDGFPTRYGGPLGGTTANTNGPGSVSTRLIEIEHGIASANALKENNARVITVGIGDGLAGASQQWNLRAVSGSVLGSDYFLVSDYAALQTFLRNLARANCEGTVNVTKSVYPVGGTAGVAAPGWDFTAAAGGPTVTLDGSGNPYATSATGTTSDTGGVGFRVDFSAGTSPATRHLSITEAAKPGFVIKPFTVAGGTGPESAYAVGDFARCWTTDAPTTWLPVQNVGSDETGNPGFTVDPVEGKTVACLVRNQALNLNAQLVVTKTWNVDLDGNGVVDVTGTGPNAPNGLGTAALTLEDNDPSTTLPDLPQFGSVISGFPVGDVVTIGENVTLTQPLCTNVATVPPPITLTLNTSQGVNQAAIVNTITCHSRLTLVKNVIDDSPTRPAPTDWNLRAITPSGALTGPQGLSGTAAATADVTPGVVYPMAETPLTGLAGTYRQRFEATLVEQWAPNAAAGATGSWVCVAASSVVDDTPVFGETWADGRNGGVTVGFGQWFRCTADNMPEPTIQLTKRVSVGGVLTTEGADQWTLTAGSWTAPASWTVLPYPRTQADVSGVGGFAATPVLPGTYTLSESAAVPEYTNGTSFSCVVNGGPPQTVPVGSNALVLVDGDEAVCEIINTGIPPAGTITKQVRTGYPVQNMDGTWTIVYDVVVTNPSAVFPLVYDLTDELSFGAGIQILTTAGRQPSWTGPSGFGDFDPPGYTTATLANDRSLAADSSETYTVTVNAEIGLDAWTSDESQLTCAAAGTLTAGGFLNSATLTSESGTQTADACATPELPDVVKSAVGPAVQDEDDPDLWHVSYTVTVTGGANPAYYTLNDAPGYPVGVAVSNGTAQRAGTPDAIPITSGAEFPAQPVPIGAGEVQTWTVRWDATVPYTVAPDALPCAPTPTSGRGFYNGVQLVQAGVVIDQSDACVPLADIVDPTVTKTVTSTTQDPATGNWLISYDVEVALTDDEEENPLGLSASYNLTDTLDFGGGIQVVSASWSGESSGTFSGTSGALAVDHEIEAGDTHVYTVAAVAAVTTTAITGATTTCTEGETVTAGGFLNRVLLQFSGGSSEADACSEPVFPIIEKTADATTDNPDGTQTIAYTVTVTYPGTHQDPPQNLVYDLTDSPTLPAGATLVGTWNVEAADADTPTPDNPTWNGTGTWTIVSGAEFTSSDVTAGLLVHTYAVSATVSVTSQPTTPPQVCADSQTSGLLVRNTSTVTSGQYTDDDDACSILSWDDVGIVKTAGLPAGQTSVEPGTTFTYVLTVTNNGTRPALAVHVTDDDLNDRLEITGLTVSPALTWTGPGYDGNVIDLTIASLDVGQVATITATVSFLPPAVQTTIPAIVGNAPPPPLTTPPLESLENTACVAATRDSVPENNCADADVPTRDIAATVYTRCVADAPLLGWTIQKSAALTANPIDVLWTPNGGTAVPPSVALSQPGGTTTWSNEIAWPGVVFTPSGISIDYPGWRAIRASDIASVGPDGATQYFYPGATTVMTPEQQALLVFNGLIADPDESDAAWRFGATVADNAQTTLTFTVNPTLTLQVEYPDAVASCAAARHSEVHIEKTASVAHTDPGASFSYTLAVANVSDDSAAEGVVVTDAIPADLRITDVSWTGEGDASAFPNWDSCAVTGQDSAGYGGALTCVLFGPLQPAGSALGASSAPTITLAATVNPASRATVITNVGIVDYHTFGDPDDSGRDADDAVVLLSSLPATGAPTPMALVAVGLLALITGAVALMVTRRRRTRGDAAG